MLNRLRQRICYYLYLRLLGSYFATADRLRAFLFQKMTAKSVDRLIIRAGVYISGYGNLATGSNVSINHNCFLSCEGGVTIGDDVSIAHGVTILSSKHSFSNSDTPIKSQPVTFHPVVIGNNIWIGAKATILAGVHLADGTIVGAGAVVTKSVLQQDTINGGVPARHIGNRLTDK